MMHVYYTTVLLFLQEEKRLTEIRRSSHELML